MKNRRELFILEDTEKEEQQKRTTGMKMLVGTLLMVGFLLSFYAFYYMLPGFWMILIVGVLGINMLFVCQNNKTASLISIVGVIATAAVLLIVNIMGFSNSLIYFLNQFVTVWNSRFGTFYSLFSLSGCTDMQRLMFWIVWALIGALILSRLVNGEYRFVLTIISMGALFLSISIHTGLSDWGAVLTMMGWFTFWGMNSLKRQNIMKILQVFAILTIFCSIVAIGTNNYTEVQGITDLKESIVDGVDKVRYGEDSLPQGDLTKASTMVGDDSDTLKLTFTKAQEMYLRGFVGSDYQGNAWTEASGAIYVQTDTSGMLDWLKTQGFETISQYAAYQKAVDTSKKSENTLSVDNVGAYSKYLYAPYEIDSSDAGSEVKDWQLQSNGLFGDKKYSYGLMDPNMPSELMVAKAINAQTDTQKNYVSAENVYRTFVYQNYTTISDDEKTLLNEQIYNNQDWSQANVYQLTTQIRIALQGKVSYSETPFEYKGGEDFTNWFLTKSKQGNSAYYATVATLAYRAAGIPARYVEGYYLTDSAATNLNNKNKTETTLTQKEAHAWTEVYMDEIGWMPVEVVPGFYFADYTTQQILDIPQSSVTIQNSDNQEELQGSTTDQLPKTTDTKKPDETVVHKTIRVLGIILLVLMILMLLYLVLQLQAKIRMNHFHNKLAKGSSVVVGGMLYDRICQIFRLDNIPGDSWFPYEEVDEIVAPYDDINAEDYTRFVSLIQKEKFGGIELSKGELHTLQAFVERLTESSYKMAGTWRRLTMKYIYCIHE